MRKYFFVLFLLGLFAAPCIAQRNYFDVFVPNLDRDLATIKNYAEKKETKKEYIPPSTGNPDSLYRNIRITTYDGEGRIQSLDDHNSNYLLKYSYDTLHRVTRYTEENKLNKKTALDIKINYTKNGDIKTIVNTANDTGAKSVTFSEKEQKLVITKTGSYMDEIYFNQGRILKVFNKTPSGDISWWVGYTYQSEKLVAGIGEKVDANVLIRFEDSTFYFSARKHRYVYTSYQKNKPDKKSVFVTSYFMDGNTGRLEKKEIANEPAGTINVFYKYDAAGRLISELYFDNNKLTGSYIYEYL